MLGPIAGAVLLALAASQPGALVGQGPNDLGASSCLAQRTLVLTGVALGDGVWKMALTIVPQGPPPACLPFPFAFQGAWSAAEGGCLAEVTHLHPFQLCVGSAASTQAQVRVLACDLYDGPCDDAHAYFGGTLTVVQT